MLKTVKHNDIEYRVFLEPTEKKSPIYNIDIYKEWNWLGGGTWDGAYLKLAGDFTQELISTIEHVLSQGEIS